MLRIIITLLLLPCSSLIFSETSLAASNSADYREAFDRAFFEQVVHSSHRLEAGRIDKLINVDPDGYLIDPAAFHTRFATFLEKFIATHPIPDEVKQNVAITRNRYLNQSSNHNSHAGNRKDLPVTLPWLGTEATLEIYLNNSDDYAVSEEYHTAAKDFFEKILEDYPYSTPDNPDTIYHSQGPRTHQAYTLKEIQSVFRKAARINSAVNRNYDYAVLSHNSPWLSTRAATAVVQVMRARLTLDLEESLSNLIANEGLDLLDIDPEDPLQSSRPLLEKLKNDEHSLARQLTEYSYWMPEVFSLQIRKALFDHAHTIAWSMIREIAATEQIKISNPKIMRLLQWVTKNRFVLPAITDEYLANLQPIVDDLDGFPLATINKSRKSWYGIEVPPAQNPHTLYKVTDWTTGKHQQWTPFAILENPAQANENIERMGDFTVSTYVAPLKATVERREFETDSPLLVSKNQLDYIFKELPPVIAMTERKLRNYKQWLLGYFSLLTIPLTLGASSALFGTTAITVPQIVRVGLLGVGLHQSYHFGKAAFQWYQSGLWKMPDVYDLTVGAFTSGALTAATGAGYSLIGKAFPVLNSPLVASLLIASLAGGSAKMQGKNSRDALITAMKFGSLLPLARIFKQHGLLANVGPTKSAIALFMANSVVSFSGGVVRTNKGRSRLDGGVEAFLTEAGINAVTPFWKLASDQKALPRDRGDRLHTSSTSQASDGKIISMLPSRSTAAYPSTSATMPSATNSGSALAHQPTTTPFQSNPASLSLVRESATPTPILQLHPPVPTKALVPITTLQTPTEKGLREKPALRKLFERTASFGIWENNDAGFQNWLNWYNASGDPGLGFQAARELLKDHIQIIHDGRWYNAPLLHTVVSGMRHSAPRPGGSMSDLETWPGVGEHTQAIVIAFGGAGAKLSSTRAFINYAKTLDRYGVSVVAVSHPFHLFGPTNRRFSDYETFFSSVEQIISHYKKLGLPTTIVGKSFGSMVGQELFYRNHDVADGGLIMVPGGRLSEDLWNQMLDVEDNHYIANNLVEQNELGSKWERALNLSMGSTEQNIASTKPLWVIDGDHNEWSTPEMLEQLVQNYANGRLNIIPGAQHIPFLDHIEPGASEPVAVKYTLELLHETGLLPADFDAEPSRRDLTPQTEVKHLYEGSRLFQKFIDSTKKPIGVFTKNATTAEQILSHWNKHYLGLLLLHAKAIRNATFSDAPHPVDNLLDKDPSAKTGPGKLKQNEIQQLEQFILNPR